MSNKSKLPRSQVLDTQAEAVQREEQALEPHALEQVTGGMRILPMYGVPSSYKRPPAMLYPIRRWLQI